MSSSQPDLFRAPPALPEGFRFQPDFLTADEEHELTERFGDLPFKEFEFRGYRGNRRVLSFGWQYDFNTMRIRRADDIPPFLLPLRQQAAAFAGLGPASLQHVLVTEYAPGAGIGWHKDKPMFGEVVVISLASPCLFRLRRRISTTWERTSLTVEPRSAYLLQGPSRAEWEHSIPALDRLRYSITFRNFKSSGSRQKDVE